MINRPVRYLVLSDLHLAHPRVPTTALIEHLDLFFSWYPPKSDLDFLFLAGDVFEKLLEFPCDDGAAILLWIGRLVRWCVVCNIKLRILEGTPSHDWQQSIMFPTLAASIAPAADVVYINKPTIERDDETGLSILYLPDEWAGNAEGAFEAVKECLAQHALVQVDIAIMHGQFRYQLPMLADHPACHDEAAYLRIVRHYISIGHIHTFSVYDRIIAQGSFDRLAHNEEEPKGAVWVELDSVAGDRFLFLENIHATPHRRIAIRGMQLESCLAQVTKAVRQLPRGSYVRLEAPRGHPVFTAFASVKDRFPDLILSKHYSDNDTKNPRVLDATLQTAMHAVPLTLTKENLAEVLLNRIAKQTEITDLAAYYRCIEGCL